ncbi:hypothetical protein H2199_007829 [Coniosporium tulheliwenetii]|uniref:Uncharacterized protein n=1 Tax=Coniosporium tulheliwenetii TaxID=3383036 RepID=A0ACC2YND9_9PEZI|nr:hypothetical protein H2199_007829 [Cladosporium sp. JES 115]
MADLGFKNWSIVHAFYADSGGFMLQARDSPPFPVTAKQIHYLVQKEYMHVPGITRKEIWDKSKADRFAKTVACLQTGWFIIQMIARAVQHLPITLLELSTISLITCTGATMFFWFYKPLNVEIPTILHIDISIAQILIDAGDAAREPFKDTPLDFPTTIQPSLGHAAAPAPRIPNDRDSQLHNLQIVITTAIPTAAYGTFHLIGWNFDFPTRTEQMLWRWTCVSMGIVLGLGCAIEAAAIIWGNYTTTGLSNLNGYKLRWPTNLLFFIPGVMYFGSRMVVIVEVVVSLRALPAGCFENVEWTSSLPHI